MNDDLGVVRRHMQKNGIPLTVKVETRNRKVTILIAGSNDDDDSIC